MNSIRIGTRSSKLALVQARWVAQALEAAHPGLRAEIVTIRTSGDVHNTIPLPKVGTKGMFVKEIEDALLADAVDVAVHSLKDLPGDLPEGLVLAAIPPRADARDALVANKYTLDTLPDGARIGTSSVRRKALLTACRGDLRVEELRGNLDTRLRKLHEGRYDGLLVACAGLDRLGLGENISQRLPLHLFVPAPGQGFLGLECREDRPNISRVLEPLSDADAFLCASAERAFQRALGGGCSVPAGAFAQVNGDALTLKALLIAPDAAVILRSEVKGAPCDAEAIGARAAEEILAQGGASLLRAAASDGTGSGLREVAE
ncbi:MAG: hydroxymethylbilane synthase [Chthonomonadales bacterium]